MDDAVKTFIEEHIDMIDKNEWEDLYNEAELSFVNMKNIGDVTSYIESAGIDPLFYLTIVPPAYLYGQDIVKYTIPKNITSIYSYAF